MNVIFTGCESIQGIKKGTSVPYGPFYKMYYLAPVQPVQSENRQIDGNGFTPQDVTVDSSLFIKLKDIKPMARVEVSVSADPLNLNRTVVSDVKQVA